MPGPRRPPSRRSEPGPPEPGGPERVQRVLARAGLGSRRGVEDLIRGGRVEINGRVAVLGDRADPEKDRVSVDGVPLATHPDLRFYALNKPAGVTTTLRDPHAERSLAAFLPKGPRVFPVGRLDRESEGLLLLTNDGDLSHRLQHPRYGVEKEYLVQVEGSLSRRAASQLATGVPLEDGAARATWIGRIERSGATSSIRLVMEEGRKRVVRRMMAALGYPVRRLVRVRVGPIRLGNLPPGRVRPLLADEVAALYRETGLKRARPRRPAWKKSREPSVEGDLG
jgi:23S rRNA pseudouridine2605 synthase